MSKPAPAAVPVPAAPAPPKPMKLAVGILKADAKNARTMEAPALRGLGVSMETFGDLSGIVWNEQTGNLVAGHQRMNRLKAAGTDEWTRVSKTEGFIVHPKTSEVFKVRIVDWDPTTERMANLTANNPEIQGEFTEDAAAQLRELEDHAQFDDLMLGELQADLDKEVRKLEEQGADDQSAGVQDSFAIIIECPSEAEQSKLLERFQKEGLDCRAVM
jgi:hypothetical protein